MTQRVALCLFAFLMLSAASDQTSAGMNLFGVAGLTPGGLGIWAGLIGAAVWWIRGMPDRKRAMNESVAAGTAATTALIQHLTSEVERLSAMVTAYSARVEHLEDELATTRAEVTQLRAVNTVSAVETQRSRARKTQ